MNELRELTAMRAEAPPPSTESLHAMRRRLTIEPRRNRLRLPAFVWRTAVAGVLACAVLVGLFVTRDVGGGTPRQVASATVFMNQAAAEVRSQPFELPDHDQFVYSRVVERGPFSFNGAVESWLRFDGKEFGQRDPRNGLTQLAEPLIPEQPSPAERLEEYETLPTDPDQLVDWAYDKADQFADEHDLDSSGDDRDLEAFGALTAIVGNGNLVPPDIKANVYRALGRFPGARIDHDVVDALGRHGVGISIEARHRREIVILDRKTYDVLGAKMVAVEAHDDDDLHFEVGDLMESSAVEERGVVDDIPDRP